MAASNSGDSSSSELMSVLAGDWITLDWLQSQSYVMPRGERASLSWRQAPSGPKIRLLLLSVAGLLMWDVLSDERTGLSFTIAAGPRQSSHLRDTWPYFTLSDLRLTQPEGPGTCTYIAQEQGGPVITLCTWFPFVTLVLFYSFGTDCTVNTDSCCSSTVAGVFVTPYSSVTWV
jgi:hypothetical protein